MVSRRASATILRSASTRWSEGVGWNLVEEVGIDAQKVVTWKAAGGLGKGMRHGL
jgi:gamma-glutamyl phosphate reductase